MTARASGDRDRVVRTRRRSDHSPAALAGIDRRLLEVLCTHRVVTQAQLCRLFPDVPERTLRYRTRRLHELGLAGRSRPYRERGSAPNHHWPTRRADCLMRGEPIPKGGERARPNPVFLAHAAALTDLYVTLATEAHAARLRLRVYRREGEAREPFTDGGRQRALAPDATVILTDAYEREYIAFVEIDRGSMSHTRLRQKAELYTAYIASRAWQERHLFVPTLLFLTTTDARAQKFLKALARALAYGPRHSERRAFIAGGGGVVWKPARLLTEACLADLDGNVGLTLADALLAARAPYEQALEHRRAQAEREQQARQVLRDDSDAMRRHLANHTNALASYVKALGPAGACAVELLKFSTGRPSPDEAAVLRAIACDLHEGLLEPGEFFPLPEPGGSVRSEVALLVEQYRVEQSRQVEALARRHGAGPRVRRAQGLLREGGLLDRAALENLQHDAERDAAGRRQQHECRQVYLQWRERSAQQRVRNTGPLGRLTHRPEEFYARIDQERLRTCGQCGQTIYPSADDMARYGSPPTPSCHYCNQSYDTKPYHPPSTTRAESETHE